jgi:hypothetical protein
LESVIVIPLVSLVLGTLGGAMTNYWLRRREQRAAVGDAERLAGYGRLATNWRPPGFAGEAFKV